MSYETSMETEIKNFPIMTVFIGKEIEMDDSSYETVTKKTLQSPHIKNKKAVVNKLIKYFKNS
jgi:hypothetical protein